MHCGDEFCRRLHIEKELVISGRGERASKTDRTPRHRQNDSQRVAVNITKTITRHDFRKRLLTSKQLSTINSKLIGLWRDVLCFKFYSLWLWTNFILPFVGFSRHEKQAKAVPVPFGSGDVQSDRTRGLHDRPTIHSPQHPLH